MKRFLNLGALALSALASCSKKPALPAVLEGETLTSPDGCLVLTFALSDEGVPMYSLRCGEPDVVLPSALGYSLRGEFKGANPKGGNSVKAYGDPTDLQKGFTLASVSRDTFDETWDPVWGEEAHIRNHYNELAVTLVQGSLDGAQEAQYYFCELFEAPTEPDWEQVHRSKLVAEVYWPMVTEGCLAWTEPEPEEETTLSLLLPEHVVP